MNLGDLLNLPPNTVEWEAERARLINDAINEAGPELRPKLTALQASLDVLRETMPPDQFLRYLMLEIQENLENMSDQFVMLKNTVLQTGA
jgi:hypothetical protein